MGEDFDFDGIEVARRDGNLKRPYLIVNRYQAKHIPTKPSQALGMMASLADTIDAKDEVAVIAFAETATAIGAAVACCIGDGCFYIHSTRAQVPEGMNSVDFEESHSHAMHHHLFANELSEHLGSIKHLVFIDDEYSTGKTLTNAIEAVRKLGGIQEQTLIHAASVVNRMDESAIRGLEAKGVSLHYLTAANNLDVHASIEGIDGKRALAVSKGSKGPTEVIDFRNSIPDPRKGLRAGEYRKACQRQFIKLAQLVERQINQGSEIVILGTEECMFPSLIAGMEIEESSSGYKTFCHATTRSPIRTSATANYPIQNGYSMRSVYDSDRKVFLYNLRHYDAAIIISDAHNDTLSAGMSDMVSVLRAHGCELVYWVMI